MFNRSEEGKFQLLKSLRIRKAYQKYKHSSHCLTLVKAELLGDTRLNAIQALHKELLNRAPTVEELYTFYKGPLTLEQIRSQLLNSAEAQYMQRIREEGFDWTEITPTLYQGSLLNATCWENFLKLNCKAILNVCEACDYVQNLHNGIAYKQYAFPDGKAADPRVILNALLTLRRWIKEEGLKVYVHCHAGISRSTTIVALFLAFENNLTFSEAVSQIRAKRPLVNPHPALLSLDSMMIITREYFR